VFQTRMRSRASVEIWQTVRSLPDFWRLIQLRMASQFGDGLFQATVAGALLFNPDRAADPLSIARSIRGAVLALFVAGTVRRSADGPLGPTLGCWSAPT